MDYLEIIKQGCFHASNSKFLERCCYFAGFEDEKKREIANKMMEF